MRENILPSPRHTANWCTLHSGNHHQRRRLSQPVSAKYNVIWLWWGISAIMIICVIHNTKIKVLLPYLGSFSGRSRCFSSNRWCRSRRLSDGCHSRGWSDGCRSRGWSDGCRSGADSTSHGFALEIGALSTLAIIVRHAVRATWFLWSQKSKMCISIVN